MKNEICKRFIQNGDIIYPDNNKTRDDDRWRDQSFRKYKDVSGFMKGDFPIHLEKVVGGIVDNIFDLTDIDIQQALLVEMLEPIRISMKAVKNCNDKKIVFEIGVSEVSDPEEITVLSLRRNKIKNLGAWIERELGDYQGVNQPVREYIEQAIETLAPILEKRAFAMYEKDSIVEVYSKIIEEVATRAETKQGFKDPKYQINFIEAHGVFSCIKGKTAFQNVLTAIGAEYSTLELLKKFDALGLLLKNGNRQYSFQNNGWWYYIRYDGNLLIKGEEAEDYE